MLGDGDPEGAGLFLQQSLEKFLKASVGKRLETEESAHAAELAG
jgi:hypothetical protein